MGAFVVDDWRRIHGRLPNAISTSDSRRRPAGRDLWPVLAALLLLPAPQTIQFTQNTAPTIIQQVNWHKNQVNGQHQESNGEEEDGGGEGGGRRQRRTTTC